MHFFTTFSLLALSPFFNCHDIGDPCPHGNPGVCVRIQDCTSAKKNIQLRKNPPLCSFKGQEPIICCSYKELKINKKSWMSSLNKITGNTSFTTVEELMKFKKGGDTDGCPPITVNTPPLNTAQKSVEKCLHYQEKYVFPCVKSPLLRQHKMMREDFCAWSPRTLISNGKKAALNEFPHMALLGFGNTDIEWKCGGTILSERFVLTAAHCTKIPLGTPVTKVKIGILNRSEPDSKTNLYDVLKIHVHEGYHSPQKYNDIALLETDREMLLSQLALPACLHDGSLVNATKVIVAGWGVTDPNTLSQADILQKANLTKFQDSECISHHQRFQNRNLLHGIDTETQMCFGDKINITNTCTGDSGGPVLIRHPRVYCMYLVLGVTSFGRSCGYIGEPGVYTRVSHYLSWIESIVWP